MTSETLNSPLVMVPVLSNTTVSIRAAASRKLLPLTRTPLFDAEPIPPKNPKGTEITSAHGQDTIRKMQALLILSENGICPRSGGMIARSTAPIVTTGV